MTQQPDSEQLQSMLRTAHGVAIFPSVIKAGLGVGGRYGEGVVLRRDESTGKWYGPYFVEMMGLSYGLQIGLQNISWFWWWPRKKASKACRRGGSP